MKRWVTTIFLGLFLSAAFIFYFRIKLEKKALSEKYRVTRITQTGPQKEALKTELLAEILDISSDKPMVASTFNLKKAKRTLLKCPLIRKADVKLHKDTLYIDYAARQPVVWVRDADNLAMDREGYLFPFSPFFTPKKLPEFCLGLTKAECEFNQKVTASQLGIAFDILDSFSSSPIFVARIDVSKALNSLLGSKEVVVILEQKEGKHMLRLSPQDYKNELKHYFSLIKSLELSQDIVVDLRVPKLAYIRESDSN